VTSEWLGPLSEGAAPEDAAADAGAGAGRYRLGGELGVGAMGRVRAAYDTLLGREVALKQVRVDGDRAAEAALLREARVTAGLDHPGIIAVLDAGADVDGRPFYAMRVVHGRSLAERVAAGLDAEARAGLMRALLQAAHAMAYAHARGVIHRDLSPRNVRVGAHGEVVVMDWGLAATIAEAAGQPVVCGTPGYRAPELARGEPAGPAADVWSLAALLVLVVTGGPPGDAPPRVARAELRSLLARALAPTPADRYADAGALVADLAAFLDGRRVGAHRDRPWHRAQRAARRHPGAVAAGLAGMTAAAVVAIALGTVASRRAADARRSRGEARAALRDMVVARAHEAVLADRRAEAEALAARADELGAAAIAAGVRAAFAGSPPVTVRPIRGEDGCATMAVRGGGERLCVVDGRLWLDGGGARRPLELGGGEPTAARFLADGGAVATTTDDGGDHVVRFDRGLASLGRHAITGGAPALDEAAGWAIVGAADQYLAIAPDGGARAVRPCAAGAAIRLIAADPASTAADPAVVVWCSDGVLVTGGNGRETRRHAPELEARLPGAAVGVVVGQRLVVGGADSRVGLVALPGGEVVHAGGSAVGPVSRLVRGPGGDVIVAGASGVGLWQPEVGAWRHVVGADAARGGGVADDRVVVFGGGTLAAWERATDPRSHRVSAGAGLAAIAWSPDGALVAFGGGAGQLLVLDVRGGELRRAAVTGEVVKSLAFAPAARALAAGVATERGLRILDSDTLAERGDAARDPALRVRRLAILGGDRVLGFGYGTTVRGVALRDGAPIAVAPVTEPVIDAAVPIATDAVYALGVRGAVWRYDGAGQRRLRDAAGAAALAISGDGGVLAAIDRDGGVELRAAATDAVLAAFAAPGAAVEDAALDPAGRQLALARIDGTVEVWRVDERRLALALQAHAGRAAAVAFSPDGCTLATAGWDAVGRLLALCAPPTLRAR